MVDATEDHSFSRCKFGLLLRFFLFKYTLSRWFIVSSPGYGTIVSRYKIAMLFNYTRVKILIRSVQYHIHITNGTRRLDDYSTLKIEDYSITGCLHYQ